MGLMSRFNGGNAFRDIDTNGFNYVSCEDVYKEFGTKPVQVQGVFINSKTKYGDSAVAIGDHVLINLPAYTVDDVKEMLQDDVVIDAFKKGRVGISVSPYKNNFSKQKDGTEKEFYGVDWIDL